MVPKYGLNQYFWRLIISAGFLIMLLAVGIPACAVGFSLDTPATQVVTAQSQVHLAGKSDLDDLMLSLSKSGNITTPIFAQQRIPVRSGRFDTWVWLPWGSGEYELALWRWDTTRKMFAQLTAFRVHNQDRGVSSALQAPPVLLWKANTQKDAVDAPTRAYSEANGLVPVKIRTGYQQLLVSISKDNVVSRSVIPVYNGSASTALWLNRGPGRYDITVWRPEEGNNFVPWAAFSVYNKAASVAGVDEVPRWFDAAWQNGRPALEIPGLQAYMGNGKGVPGSKLVLSGHSSFPYLVASVERNGEMARYRVPVNKDGTFTATVWLRFGAGVHNVTLWADKTGRGELSGLVRFAALAPAGKDLRYLAPSLGIESDHAEIAALAHQLVKPGASAQQAALAVHDWVTKNIAYDVAKFRNGTIAPDDGALKTLRTRKGVCQDFANLTTALLRAAGVPARLAVGQAQGYSFGGRGEWGPHAWVEVQVGARWLVMDPTWDAGGVDASGHFVRKPVRTYFDPDPAAFKRSHRLQRYEY